MARVSLHLVSSGLILLCVLVLAPASVAASELEPFFGHYTGRSQDAENSGVSKRDFEVEIEPIEKQGFKLSWRTVIHRNDGSEKDSAYSIEFRPSDREGIYASAEKKDLFGAKIPSDPMKGDAYLWAKIDDNRITVYGFQITDDGGYEMQIYHRTLTDTGMDLEFIRQREDGVMRRLSGDLQRVEE